MNQDILSYIMNHAGSLSLQEILVNFIAAIAVGGVIFLSYRFSHSWGPLQWKIQRVPLVAHLSDHAGHVRHRQ